MNIVHFCITPMAGSPIRIVRALQRHSQHNVRLIDLDRWHTYDQDIVFSETPEHAAAVAEQADIIHFHNYLDYGTDLFAPIDFHRLKRRGKIFVRQFHSTPQLVSRVMGCRVRDLLASDMPSMVVAQFQERYYPQARVVPNIIAQDRPAYRPLPQKPEYGLFFNPSNIDGAWQDRWNTKGAPETINLMKRAARQTGTRIRWMTGAGHEEVLAAMGRSRVVITDLVTGSYHLASLEGLSLGKPTLAYLDRRTARVLRTLSGAAEHPFVDVRLESALPAMVHLLKHPDTAQAVGQAGRIWMETFWNERRMVAHYERAYTELADNPSRLDRQPSLSLDSPAERFHAIGLPDIDHGARAARAHRLRPRITGLLLRIARICQRLKKRMVETAPSRQNRKSDPS